MTGINILNLTVTLSGCSQRYGDLRLGGYGSTKYGGRVEMFTGQWYAICNDASNYHIADVVCRQLGLGYFVTLVNRGHGGREPNSKR